jgi:hypothetical protein
MRFVCSGLRSLSEVFLMQRILTYQKFNQTLFHSGNALHSHSRCTWFEYWQGHRYPDWGVSCLPQSLRVNAGIIPKLGHDRVKNHLQFIITLIPSFNVIYSRYWGTCRFHLQGRRTSQWRNHPEAGSEQRLSTKYTSLYLKYFISASIWS